MPAARIMPRYRIKRRGFVGFALPANEKEAKARTKTDESKITK
jgi:hypothetical protein